MLEEKIEPRDCSSARAEESVRSLERKLPLSPRSRTPRVFLATEILSACIPVTRIRISIRLASFSHQVLLAALDEAQQGAQATAQMKPRLGRSSYLQDRVLGHPDPGAIAVVIWLRAVTAVLAGTPTSV